VRVLVTGGHGFVGSHLVARLLESGARVRCLVRSPSAAAAFAGLEVEIAHGDLRTGAGLRAACAGVEGVFHLAALTRALSRREMWATNAAGTARLAGAAARAGLSGRFVFCSSLSAVGPSASGEPLTEDAPARPLGWYGESKAAAERHLLERRWPFEVSVVRPPAVYGPRDRDFLSLFQGVARGWAPHPTRLADRLSLVHAADLAQAFERVADAATPGGGIWFAAHPEVLTVADLIAAAERALGRRARRAQVPPGLLRLVGRLADLCAQVTGRASLFGTDRLREVGARHWVCSPRRLVEEAGWRPRRDLATGFAETVAWYRQAGRLPGAER
jgi:nucleoside-diphosphate-sugar epimerase